MTGPRDPSANIAEAFNASCSLSPDETSDWYMDSGASTHMTPSPNGLNAVISYGGKDRVLVGNGSSLNISHTGSCDINSEVTLRNVLVVPHLTCNLLSISQLCRDFPLDVHFSDDYFVIQNRETGHPVAKGRREGGSTYCNMFIPHFWRLSRINTYMAPFNYGMLV